MSASSIDSGYKLGKCKDCGVELNLEEDHYYGDRCERCEWVNFERHQDWLRGASDPELDERYG